MIRRLNWGCGQVTRPGWVNADLAYAIGVDIIRDIRQGLPLESDSFDYVVSIHALPELPYCDVDQALGELHRVLKPSGVLRLGLPDMDKAIQAYLRRDLDYFLVSDDVVTSAAGKMIVQLTWHGRSRLMFTWEFTEELLSRAGFREVRRCQFRQSPSELPGITELDNREEESLFVEAVK
jgi:SAM-dependent methyltransferase